MIHWLLWANPTCYRFVDKPAPAPLGTINRLPHGWSKDYQKSAPSCLACENISPPLAPRRESNTGLIPSFEIYQKSDNPQRALLSRHCLVCSKFFHSEKVLEGKYLFLKHWRLSPFTTKRSDLLKDSARKPQIIVHKRSPTHMETNEDATELQFNSNIADSQTFLPLVVLRCRSKPPEFFPPGPSDSHRSDGRKGLACTIANSRHRYAMRLEHGHCCTLVHRWNHAPQDQTAKQKQTNNA